MIQLYKLMRRLYITDVIATAAFLLIYAQGERTMEVLTDEMIAELMRGNVNMMLGVFISSALVFLWFTAVFIKSAVAFKSAKQGKVKSFLSEEKSLLIKTAVTGAICLVLLIAALGAYVGADIWHLEYATVSDKKTEIDDNADTAKRKYYIIHINEYPQAVKVTKDEYGTIEIGERVYVLVSGGDHADEIWETDRYLYTGNRLQ